MAWAELLSACAQNRGDFALWTEFLKRYGPRIKQFLRGTLLNAVGKTSSAGVSSVLGGMQQSDLFQCTILRLIEQDCAVLKKFSGTTEYDFHAYLAVITRSVVREALRRQRAMKRPGGAEAIDSNLYPVRRQSLYQEQAGHSEMERELLAREVRSLGEQKILDLGQGNSRDMLILRLYFDHDLSFTQIGQCRDINLSKAGVEKVLRRLREIIRSAVSEESSRGIMR